MTPTAIATRGDRIQRTLEHLRQHTTDTTGQLVPFGPGQYTDPALAQRERDLVFGRVPTADETTLAVGFLAEVGNNAASWERYAQALLVANEFVFVD